MAVTYVKPAKATVDSVAHICNPNEASDAVTAVTVGTDGAWLAGDFDDSNLVSEEFKDAKTCIRLSASSAADVVFKAGDSYAACNDLTVSLGAGEAKYIAIDSAYFKVVNGDTGLGGVFIKPTASVSVEMFEMR